MNPSLKSLAALLLLAISLPNAHAFRQPTIPELPNFDRRATSSAAPGAEAKTAATGLTSRVAGLKVDFDEHIGTPKWIWSAEGFLSGPSGIGKGISAQTAASFPANDIDRATKAFLQDNQALFGFGAEVLTNARSRREFVTPHSGLRTVIWEQELDGISIFEAVLISHTSKDGELVNLSSQFIPAAAQAADLGTPNRQLLAKTPLISAAKAIALAMTNLGENLEESDVIISERSSVSAEQRQRLQAALLAGDADAKLIWLPMSQQSLRLCWQVILTSRARGEMYLLLVDAGSGEPQVRHRLTEYLTDATYRVWTSDSPSPFSPGYSTPQTNQPPVVPRQLITLSALNTNASPNGWIDDGNNETSGNNVDAHTDRNADNVPDLPRPQGNPTRVFDFTLDLTQPPSAYTNASVVQLFYWNNWMHDKLYELGFTEAAGNFQNNNFGRGGAGNDAVQADAEDGSGTDNANFSTPPDGSPGRMQMYVFTGPTPDRDGDLDAEVVLHEYTHGLSNRRVGGGVGISALQSGGMGEGWSDFYGLSLLSEAGDDVNGVYAAGAYASFLINSSEYRNYYFGIRRYPYCTDMTKNPLTLNDIDSAQADNCSSGAPYNTEFFGSCSTASASEVHNIGEVWCVTLWEARANLINKYGWAVGNQLVLKLVTDGMNLSPPNPTILQARDAILQADQVYTGGANRAALWAAFAKRGMGLTAFVPSSSTTTGVIQKFDLPDDLQINPSTLAANGPVGGPFTPNPAYFTLTNTGSNTLTWALASTAGWFSVSPTGGTLPAGAGGTVAVTLSTMVTNFPLGTTNALIWFTNQSSGVAQSRTFSLSVVGRSMFEDFEPGIHMSLWSGFGGTVGTTVIATNYGGSVSGVNSLWFGDAGTRFAATIPINTSAGGTVSFYLRLGNSSYPWEMVDIPAEGIVLEYSTNSGVSWDVMGTYDTSTFYNWTQVNTTLPATALSPATQFRWRQLSHSGSDFDHWALDDISIDAGPTPPYIVSQPANRTAKVGSNVTFSVSVQGSFPLNYQWRKDGANLSDGGRITGATSPTLSISNLVENDNGLYSVVVSNLYGSVTSSNATLLVTPLDHFNWSVVASPQAVAVPFNATVIAKDPFDVTVTNYTGTVALSAANAAGTATNMILGNLTNAGSGSGVYTLGFAFTPNTNIVVTHVRSMSGTKVSIWLTNGTLLANQNVVSVPGTWVETPLASPLNLAAGTTYIVSFYSATTYYYRPDRTNTFPDGTIEDAYYYYAGDSFPITPVVSPYVYLVDLKYVRGASATVPITPATAGPFTNGIWSGSITVQQPATNLILRADDGAGHSGMSNPFDTLLQNDISITVADSPDPVSVGANLTYTLTIANAGPSAATGVMVTNLLPANVSFVSATPSQGSCSQAGGVVTGNLGLVPGGTNATIRIVVVPNSAGVLSNYVTVFRAEADAYAGNNSAVATTVAQVPGLSISDCIVLERNTGTTNAVFNVTLNSAAALAVTVNYATADGTAVAGSDYIATNGTLAFAPGETNKTILVAVRGDTLGEADETFFVNLTSPLNATLVDSQGVGTILNDDVPSAAYVRSTAGAPWGSLANETAMNRVLGTNNWQDLRYETVNVGVLLSPVTTFIYMEGSDVDATEMETFLNANINAIQSWVSNGGSLFLNAAPNEDNGMSMGFGVTLLYPDSTSAAAAALQTHRIFSGPFSPVGLAWTGTQFAHATVSGSGLTALITNTATGGIVLGELPYGAGHVLFGGMTTDNYHSPQPQAANLRANIIAYLSSFSSYHFEWSSVSSPQQINVPFAVTITARDSANAVVTNFTGALGLSAMIGTNQPISITPVSSDNFTNGLWSGMITVLQPGQSVVLNSDDGSGRTSSSNPFDVIAPNDIGLTGQSVPNPVALGANVTYTLTVTNSGPASATGVTLTNNLAPGAGFVSATASQGACLTNGSVVSCDLGNINGGATAVVSIVATAVQSGILTNQATVFRQGADAYLGNNTALVITPVVLPSISINDISVREGNFGTTNAIFTVTIGPAPAQVTAVAFDTAPSTASAPSDYLATNGIIVFAPGQTTQTVSVVVNGDTTYEQNEIFLVNLSGSTNANIGKAVGIGTIVNDDTPPSISIGDVTVLEGNVGTNLIVFPVTLSAPNGLNTAVSYTTVNGTATNGSDYVAKSGSLTFAAGVTSNFITVAVIGDTQVEGDEDFYVDLSNPVNATLAKREGLAILLNDDGLAGQVDHFVWSPAGPTQYVNEPFAEIITALDTFNNPALSFNGTAILSGLTTGGSVSNTILPATNIYSSGYSGGTCGYSFTPTNDITVTHVRSYSGTKVSIWTDTGTLLASQPVSGQAGIWTETALSTPLKLTGGIRYRVGIYSPNGNIYYSLNATNVFAAGTIDQGYLIFGDLFPTSVSAFRWFFVDLRFTRPTLGPVQITPVNTGPFTNGVWAGNITVPSVMTNLILRADDGNGHSGQSAQPISVILHNDLSLAVSDFPHPVCLGGKISYSLIVSNTGPAAATNVTVTNLLSALASFVSASSSQGTCTNNGSTVTCDLGSIDGLATASITIVASVGQLGNVTNKATAYRAEFDPYTTNNSVTTVTPVVSLPSLTINDVSVREGNSGTTNANFTVSLSPPPAVAGTVNFATANQTANAPGDYSSTNGVLSFGVGETNKTISVSVNGNTIYGGPNKTFLVLLSGAVNATLIKSSGIGTIVNDDAIPALSIANATLLEGNVATTNAVFVVTLSVPSSLTTTFFYSTAGGTAGSLDFVGKSGTISLPPLVTSTNLVVTILCETNVEPDETFYVDLSAPVNATLAKREAVATIVNDDGIPGWVDHFAWNALPAAQYAGEPFSATIVALDAFGGPAVAFSGAVNLTASDAVGVPVPITPSGTAPFNNAVWTGNLIETLVVTNLTLRADDGNGHSGLSGPINILPHPALAYAISNGWLILSWTGPHMLQSSTNVIGPYLDIPEAVSPWSIDMSKYRECFFRLSASPVSLFRRRTDLTGSSYQTR
jgi:uncharacterized repeat protein (TIGR01451 family)